MTKKEVVEFDKGVMKRAGVNEKNAGGRVKCNLSTH